VFIIKAFLSGFDAVLVLGCHPGDCHYLTGNFHAEKKMKMAKRLLNIARVGEERLHLDWVSAGEGGRFAQIVTTFTDRVKAIGPFDRDESLLRRLHAAKLTAQEEKIRWLVGNEINLLEKGNVYGEKLSPSEFDLLMDATLQDEYIKNWIALLVKESPKSVKEIAANTKLSLEIISSHLIELEESGRVALCGFEGRSPKYRGG
jgi:DNA-binding transcriptional ArsR family regulator